MKSIIFVSTLILFSACTYSVTIVHSQGHATDLVDETQSPTNDVSPSLTVPASLIHS